MHYLTLPYFTQGTFMLCISVGQIQRGKNLKWRNKGFQEASEYFYDLIFYAHLIQSFFVFPCHTELETSAQIHSP